MGNQPRFCVSDWNSYKIVRADDHFSAVHKCYKKRRFRLIGEDELDDNTVTHAMCCEYTEYMQF